VCIVAGCLAGCGSMTSQQARDLARCTALTHPRSSDLGRHQISEPQLDDCISLTKGALARSRDENEKRDLSFRLGVLRQRRAENTQDNRCVENPLAPLCD